MEAACNGRCDRAAARLPRARTALLGRKCIRRNKRRRLGQPSYCSGIRGLIPSDRKETGMPTLIDKPTRIQAAGNKPKVIDEFVGRVNSGEARLSVARMRSPG